MIEIRTAHVNENGDLSLSRRDHIRVTMAGVAYGNPRSKIKVFIAVNIFNPLSPAF